MGNNTGEGGDELSRFLAEVSDAELAATSRPHASESATAAQPKAPAALAKRSSAAVISRPAEPAHPRASHTSERLSSTSPAAPAQSAQSAPMHSQPDQPTYPLQDPSQTLSQPPSKPHIPAHQQHQIELPEPASRFVGSETSVPPYAPPNHPTRATTSNPDLVPPDKKRRGEHETLRAAAGTQWRDDTLADWPDADYRIFVGNLGPETTDEILARNFSQYRSFARARVVRNKQTGKTRGYGFVSLLDSRDFAQALREMHGRYVGNRPVMLKRSRLHERQDNPESQSTGKVGKGKGKLGKRKHLPV